MKLTLNNIRNIKKQSDNPLVKHGCNMGSNPASVTTKKETKCSKKVNALG